MAGLALHPQSNTYRDRLWNGASDRPGDINLTFEGYTYPIHDARRAAGLYPVRVTGSGNLSGKTSPWNSASGSDGQVIVLDPPTGREWNLWQVSF